MYDIRDKGVDKKAFQPPSLAPSVPDAASQAAEQGLLEAIANQAPQVDRKRIQEAIDLARQCHAGTFRKSGEPFYHHPMEVARILLGWTQDEEGLIAALLHDTVEDTPLSLSQIALRFSPRVARLVAGVTKLDATGRRLALSKEDNFQRLAQEMDTMVFLVKAADRSHNLRTIEGHSDPKKRQRIAEETARFFVPLASRLGFPAVGHHLQGLVDQILAK